MRASTAPLVFRHSGYLPQQTLVGRMQSAVRACVQGDVDDAAVEQSRVGGAACGGGVGVDVDVSGRSSETTSYFKVMPGLGSKKGPRDVGRRKAAFQG